FEYNHFTKGNSPPSSSSSSSSASLIKGMQWFYQLEDMLVSDPNLLYLWTCGGEEENNKSSTGTCTWLHFQEKETVQALVLGEDPGVFCIRITSVPGVKAVYSRKSKVGANEANETFIKPIEIKTYGLSVLLQLPQLTRLFI